MSSKEKECERSGGKIAGCFVGISVGLGSIFAGIIEGIIPAFIFGIPLVIGCAFGAYREWKWIELISAPKP